jgi:hypothetical protein
VTVEFAYDLGSRLWGNQSLVTSNRRIPIKNTFGRDAVVFCACEMIQLFSVVFCVAEAVHKFEFGFIKSGTTNKRRPVFVTKTTSCSDRD